MTFDIHSYLLVIIIALLVIILIIFSHKKSIDNSSPLSLSIINRILKENELLRLEIGNLVVQIQSLHNQKSGKFNKNKLN